MMTIKSSVNRVLIPVVLFLCVLVVVIKNKMVPFTSIGGSTSSEVVTNSVVVGASASVPQVNESGVSVISPEKAESQWNPVMRNEANRSEATEWFASRGNYDFYGPDYRDDYQYYDLEALRKLGRSGNVRALHLLADMQETLPEKKVFLLRAAVYGSTLAIDRIGSMIEVEQGFFHKSEKERRPYAIEALAYYEAATLRGDKWANIQSGVSLLRRYPIELTQEDRELIRTRGKEIYDHLQQGRDLLGLGEFDNSVPDVVNKFFEETISNSCDKRYTKNPSVLLCNAI